MTYNVNENQVIMISNHLSLSGNGMDPAQKCTGIIR